MKQSRALLTFALVSACGDGGHATTTSSTNSTAARSSDSSAASPPKSDDPLAPAKVERADPRVVTKALARGRELAKDGKWADAAAAFRDATAADPESPIGFSELGWAELQAGDMEASSRATNRGLELVRDPKTKSSLLYNRGRVEEAKADKDAARKSYEASLALRRNDAVQKRLESLGGTAPAPVPIARPATCARTFATLSAACDCLKSERASFGLPKEADASCVAVELESSAARLLEVVRVSAGAESVLWVLLDVKGRLQPAATIEGEVVAKKLLEPIKGDASLNSLLFERTSTASGKTVRTTAELLCLLGGRREAPACPLEVPHAVAELKEGRPDPDRTVTLSRIVKADGHVEVKKQGGPKDLVPSGAIGSHLLFSIQ